MTSSRKWYRYDVAFVMALSVAALSACGSESGLAEFDAEEPLETAEQPTIGGATIFEIRGHVDLPPSGKITASVQCPNDSVVVGGGHYVSSGAAYVRVHASYNVSNGWEIRALNISGFSTGLDIHAQCLRGTTATSTPQWSSSIALQPLRSWAGSVTCPDGVLAGGGYMGNTAFHPYWNAPMDGPPEVMWTAGGQNMNPSASTSFKVQAICLSGFGFTGLESLISVKLDTILPGGTTTYASPACPTGTLLSSAGYQFDAPGPSIAKGTHRNSQGRWTTQLVNKGQTEIRPWIRELCLNLFEN